MFKNFDFKYIFDNNLDVGVYDGIREYARNYLKRRVSAYEIRNRRDPIL